MIIEVSTTFSRLLYTMAFQMRQEIIRAQKKHFSQIYPLIEIQYTPLPKLIKVTLQYTISINYKNSIYQIQEGFGV